MTPKQLEVFISIVQLGFSDSGSGAAGHVAAFGE